MSDPDLNTSVASNNAPREVVVFGASGGIGSAIVHHYAKQPGIEVVHAVSRRLPPASQRTVAPARVQHHIADSLDEQSLNNLSTCVNEPDLVVVATGLLSDGDTLRPEKSLKQQSESNFERVFAVNTIGPALIAKHLLPKMPRLQRSVFAALSARVGSISDNRLGGWHAYRASKAALNMLIRNYAIELERTHPHLICVGLHPGTVDTNLSKPFSRAVPKDKLFSPDFAAERLASVIGGLAPEDSGCVFDWAGQSIPA